MKTPSENHTEEDKKQPEGSSEKPMTREQRRLKERIEAEAHQILTTLQSNFLEFFITTEDPEGPEVGVKIKQVCAQWRTYCSRRSLLPTAYALMNEYCDEVIKDYQVKRTEKPEEHASA